MNLNKSSFYIQFVIKFIAQVNENNYEFTIIQVYTSDLCED